MEQKLYENVNNAGVGSLVSGILTIVAGVISLTAGIIMAVNAVRLLRSRRLITF